MRYFICEHCGNIVEMVKDKGVPVMCCGQKMTEIIPGTSDGAVEKHLPVWTVEGNTVKVSVGSVEHPMVEAHYIEWVSLQTKSGNQRKVLKPGDAPESRSCICILQPSWIMEIIIDMPCLIRKWLQLICCDRFVYK